MNDIYILWRRHWRDGMQPVAAAHDDDFSDHYPRCPRIPPHCTEYVQQHRPRDLVTSAEYGEITAEQFAVRLAMHQEGIA